METEQDKGYFCPSQGRLSHKKTSHWMDMPHPGPGQWHSGGHWREVHPCRSPLQASCPSSPLRQPAQVTGAQHSHAQPHTVYYRTKSHADSGEAG